MKIVYSAAVILVLFFFLIRFIEKRSLYFPLRDIEATPEDIHLDYQDVMLTASDGVEISAWFVPSASPAATVLFCHGNGGNISHRLEKIRILHSLNVNILLFDYRGYGRSKGSPTEDGLYLDAEAAYDYLVNDRRIPPDRIIGYGESLGGAVIVDLAARHPLRGLILEGSFTSIPDMAHNYFPFIPAFVFKAFFNSYDKIREIKAPKLHFHSRADEIVPFELGKKLYDNGPDPKKLVELQGGHNDSFLVSEDLYVSELRAFTE